MRSPGLIFQNCVLVALFSTHKGLGGWPLPALADDCALHATRTKGFLQSGQKTLESRLLKSTFRCFDKTLESRLLNLLSGVHFLETQAPMFKNIALIQNYLTLNQLLT
ncbi:MAG: hypothetical protein CFE38_16115 [Comamonadaceae bacterium PBBC1]|nr:MAG: hypothetical protein CFE38_16115 [Comamonadaceae bacterium PBBC1]